jgi:hypothetical protein
VPLSENSIRQIRVSPHYLHFLLHRNAGSQSGGGHEVAAGRLHQAVQHPAQVVRASFCRALQGTAGGWERERLFAHGLRLCAFEPGAGQTSGGWGAPGELRLEPLRPLSPSPGQTSGLAAGGPGAGGKGNSQG